MEEEITSQSDKPQNSKGLIITLFLVLTVFLVGGSFVFLKNSISKTSSSLDTPPTPMTSNETENRERATDEDSMVAGQNTVTINVEGGNYYFKPNEIIVKKDEEVKIVFSSIDGFHDFIIDEFNVKTNITAGGKTAEVTFTPDKAGTYEFYCNVGNHRVMGMVGTLTVEE
jgi:heme/copper-type cytochrome/quinol oxidase subunit 2